MKNEDLDHFTSETSTKEHIIIINFATFKVSQSIIYVAKKNSSIFPYVFNEEKTEKNVVLDSLVRSLHYEVKVVEKYKSWR